MGRATHLGEETSVRFINRTEGEVELWWINNSGGHRSYGKIKPGREHRQHTYARHVGLVTDAAGKRVGLFEEVDVDGDAIIDGRDVKPENDPPQQQRDKRDLSPDGRWRALIRDNNVYLRDTKAKDEFALSADGSSELAYRSRFFWSPDSTKLVVIQETVVQHRQIHLIESSPREQLQPKLHTLNYAKPGDALPQPKPRLFDVTTRTQIPFPKI